MILMMGLFKGILDMDEAGYLLTQPGSTATNVEGVFGRRANVVDDIYRQARRGGHGLHGGARRRALAGALPAGGHGGDGRRSRRDPLHLHPQA